MVSVASSSVSSHKNPTGRHRGAPAALHRRDDV